MDDFDGSREIESTKECGLDEAKPVKETTEDVVHSLDAAIDGARAAHRSLNAALEEASLCLSSAQDLLSASDDTSDSSSSLSESDIDDSLSDGGWGQPIQNFPCVAIGSTGNAELAEIANEGDETMNLFAVSWRSRSTPTAVSILFIKTSTQKPCNGQCWEMLG